MSKKHSNLVWIDLEMTGLDPRHCTILEIATIVTDSNLNILDIGPNLAIHQPDPILEGMDAWNTTHHTASGLYTRVQESQVTMEEAERQTLDFIKRFSRHREAPLCGNTIGQDRRFLDAYMPSLEAHLHYRNIDVSSIKELVTRWYPESYLPPRKKTAHLALEDIKESIEELRYYQRAIFIPVPESS